MEEEKKEGRNEEGKKKTGEKEKHKLLDVHIYYKEID